MWGAKPSLANGIFFVSFGLSLTIPPPQLSLGFLLGQNPYKVAFTSSSSSTSSLNRRRGDVVVVVVQYLCVFIRRWSPFNPF
jgi:hypothetical protein